MSTHFFHSGMVGAPTNTSAAGSTLAIIRSCLVTGFNVKPVLSATVASGVMTLTYAAAHGYEDKVWIRLDGAPGGSITQRASVTSTAVLTIPAPGFAAGAVIGTLSTRVAPADWEEAFTGTLKAVFRSKVEGPGSTRFFYRVSDTVEGNIARLRGFESMTDVDTGAGPYPTVSQVAGEGLGIFRSNGPGRGAGLPADAWAAVCDNRTVYLTLARYQNQSIPSSTLFCSLMWFGDEQPLNNTDNFCAAVGGGEDQLFSATYFRARAFGAGVGSQSTNSPSNLEPQTLPSPVFGGLLLLQPRLLLNGSSNYRSVLRGAIDTTADPVPTNSTHIVMTDVSGLSGRAIFLRTGQAFVARVACFHDGDWS